MLSSPWISSLAPSNARDLQAMSTVFGTNKGPARETMDRTELEKREIILACYFNNDSYRILGERSGQGGHREVSVELKKGNLIRTTTFYAIRGPGGRWYVDNMDIAAVRDFCGNPGTSRAVNDLTAPPAPRRWTWGAGKQSAFPPRRCAAVRR